MMDRMGFAEVKTKKVKRYKQPTRQHMRLFKYVIDAAIVMHR